MARRAAKVDNGPEAEIRLEVGVRIAKTRKSLGLSAGRVAQVLGITREALTHIETGRNNITAVSLWKLATLFHCDIASLFPTIPDGYALTSLDARKIKLEAGEQAARWAKQLFSSPDPE